MNNLSRTADRRNRDSGLRLPVPSRTHHNSGLAGLAASLLGTIRRRILGIAEWSRRWDSSASQLLFLVPTRRPTFRPIAIAADPAGVRRSRVVRRR